MLQRVVRNRFELSVSLPADFVFKGRHNGILVGSEQAQTLRAPAERMAFHSKGRLLLPLGHYDICRWKFRKTYQNR